MGSYMEIAVQIKKFSILSMRTFHRSVRQHPLLVGMILFLVFLYRSFPFLFSLLLSASPVLVCTAVLLGTLLSFGQPNIPEIEKEDKLSHDVVSLKTTGVSGNATFVVERDESFVIEKYSGDRGDSVDKSIEDVEFVDDKFHCKVESRLDLPDCVPLIDKSSREIHTAKRGVEDMERSFLDFEFEKKKETIQEDSRIEEGVLSDEKAVEDHQYSLVPEIADDQIVAVDVDVAHGESVETYKEDHIESSQPAGGDDDDNEEDDSSYSESDRAESSSPDASMTDIIPMLDELHPLLDLEAPQAPHMSHDEFDVASEHSHGSDLDSADLDAETENPADEVEEDGADDNDDDEEAQGGKDDESKAAIKWTEDDQKNLLDLGTSELERNQRLENLIARRRARKSFRLMAERNLIDLDSSDLSFNVPPIATTRHNPFEHPYDSNENMGLPPIPGSAPSILLPRRNPFDLPYDSNEEKPDLKGDNFEQEFLTFHQKDILFRRHESFSLGPSGLGGSRQDTKWKPVFVPEQLVSEGTSYPSFQRQLSEVSESKLSSVPDTESASSVGDADEKNLAEQVFSQDVELPANAYQASDVAVEHGSEASDDVDSVEMEQAQKRDIEHEEDIITLREAENHHETELDLSDTRDVAAHVELNSSIVDLETKSLKEEECSRKSSLSSPSEVDNRLPYVKSKDSSKNLEEGGPYSGQSVIPAHSSLEESEFQFTSSMVSDNQNKEPVYDSSPPATERLLSMSSISSDIQVEMSEIVKPSTSGEIGESFEGQLFFVEGESTDKDTSGCKEMTVASKIDAVKDIAIESGDVTVSREIDGPENDDQIISVAPASGPVHISIDSGSFSSEIQLAENTENRETSNVSDPDIELPTAIHHDEGAKLHTVDSTDLISFDDTIFSEEHGEQASCVEHASVCSKSRIAPLEKQAVVWEESINLDQRQIQEDFSSQKTSGEDVSKGEVFQAEEKEVKLSSSDSDTKVESSQDLGVWLEVLESSYQHAPSNDLPVAVLEEAQHLLVVEHVSVVHPSSCSLESDHANEVPITVEGMIPFVQDQLHSSSSDAKVEASFLQVSDSMLTSAKRSSFELEKELSWSDKPMVETEIADHDKHHESTIIMEKTEEELSISHDDCEPLDKVLANLSSGTSDSASISSNPLQYKPLASEIDLQDSILDGIANVDNDELLDHSSCELKGHVAEEDIKEEVDEIKEIDEGLLSELDTVGDFRVKELVAESLHSKLILEEANVGNSEPEVLLSSSNPSETSPELPILEVRSLEDIDLAFKQLHEGADIEEVILPSVLEEWLVIEESSETIADMKIVNARSLEDIEIALKQVSEGDVSGLPTPSNPKNESTKVGTSSDLEVVKATSVEDIEIALKQVSEGDVNELTTPFNSKNESTEAGISDVGSTIEAEPDKAESGLEEVSSIAAYDLKEGSHESMGNSITSTLDDRDKKSKDRLLRSGSGCISISGSSSSSSDSE